MKSPKNFVPPSKQVHKQDTEKTSETENLKRSAEVGDDDNLTPEGDLTQDDIEALGSKQNLSTDMGDDEELKHRSHPVDFSAGDLDIPGAELDDKNEDIGEEDEENNHYSIGGDNGL